MLVLRGARPAACCRGVPEVATRQPGDLPQQPGTGILQRPPVVVAPDLEGSIQDALYQLTRLDQQARGRRPGIISRDSEGSAYLPQVSKQALRGFLPPAVAVNDHPPSSGRFGIKQ